jgi:hypothetical protein
VESFTSNLLKLSTGHLFFLSSVLLLPHSLHLLPVDSEGAGAWGGVEKGTIIGQISFIASLFGLVA